MSVFLDKLGLLVGAGPVALAISGLPVRATVHNVSDDAVTLLVDNTANGAADEQVIVHFSQVAIRRES